MLTFPEGHTPRYTDFSIEAISDETIREGGERALYGASDKDKIRLVEKLSQAGIKDIDVGSGMHEAQFLRKLLVTQDSFDSITDDTNFSFNLTLKTWEPLVERLEKDVPRSLLHRIYVSIGMIEIGSDEQLFEHVAERLRRIGVGRLRCSLLNAFSTEIEEDKYSHLMAQIDRARNVGISLIRINDSVGTLYPDSTAVLAANLVHDNKDMKFYLHGHNDRGLGTANSLVSILHGFQIIEGGVAGVGNRAGLAELESITRCFEENNIRVNSGPIDVDRVIEAARFSEQIYLTVPTPYRPVSGFLVTNENAGIVNVPDYLGVSRDVNYFLNRVGLFPTYLQQILVESGLSENALNPIVIESVYNRLQERFDRQYTAKLAEYERLVAQIDAFYDDIVSLTEVVDTAKQVLQEQPVEVASLAEARQ
ncbi:2-isopropylmalate synthase [Brevibacterium luteolum]|uniref:2-isopropylmalate synthase n=1 Tax=Brevibacterium luteolum TaxID=199591 RepID=A0A6G8KWR4_9MICO|nr:2-isopropylmalate synthase [Brevibacterium luteolum]QIN29254.1 2-isopropylmalate synthase [Brevibacterium luteolum]